MTQSPSDRRYAVNDTSIVFDVLEGEVVLVNLDSGSYYILEGTASAIWQMVAAGWSLAEAAAALSRRYTGEAGAIESAVADFVAQLEQEAAVVPAPEGHQPASTFDERQIGGDAQPFAPPVMYRYTDMQALIQMDPIREYDETGWPRRPQPPPRRAE